MDGETAIRTRTRAVGARRGRHCWPLALLIAITCVPGLAAASTYSAAIRWQPSASADIDGYRVYVRMAGTSYGPGQDVGQPAPAADGTLSVICDGFDTSVSYAVVVSAYASSGLESDFSNELTLLPTSSDPPPPPPVVTRTSPPPDYFGNADGGGTPITTSPDRKRASPFVLAEPARVKSLWMLLANPGAVPQTLQAIVYDDAGGVPDALVATGSPVELPPGTPPAWIALPFETPVGLDAGTYWLGALSGPGGTGVFFIDGGPGGRCANDDLAIDGPSDPFGPPRTWTGALSVYAEYDPESSSPPPSIPHLFGNSTVEGMSEPLRKARTEVSPFPIVEPGLVTNLWMYLANPGSAPQVIRAVVYTDIGGAPSVLAGTGTEVTIAPGTPPGWVPLPLAAPVALLPGRYWLGVHAGPVGGCLYFFGTAPAARVFRPDMYGNGPDLVFGPQGTLAIGPISILAQYTPLTTDAAP